MMNLNWMSNNATKEGLEQITKTLLQEVKTTQTKQSDKADEIKKNIFVLQKLQSSLR